MSGNPKETFTIKIEGNVDSQSPTLMRLKRLLKLTWRGYQLKCIAITDESGAELLGINDETRISGADG
jgi:hypothetical protein